MPRCESCNAYYWPWSREITAGEVHVLVWLRPFRTKSYRIVCRQCSLRHHREATAEAAFIQEEKSREDLRLQPTRRQWLEHAPEYKGDILQVHKIEQATLSYVAAESAWRWNGQSGKRMFVQILGLDDAIRFLFSEDWTLARMTTEQLLSPRIGDYAVKKVLEDENRDFFRHLRGDITRLPDGRIGIVWFQGPLGSNG